MESNLCKIKGKRTGPKEKPSSLLHASLDKHQRANTYLNTVELHEAHEMSESVDSRGVDSLSPHGSRVGEVDCNGPRR